MRQDDSVEIDGVRFAKWRQVELRNDSAVPKPSLSGVAVAIVGVLWLFGVLTVSIRYLPTDPHVAQTVMLGGFGVAMAVPYAAALITALRLARRVAGIAAPQAGGEVQVIASLKIGDQPIGRTPGSLRADHGFLCFAGKRFDFRLKRSDLKAPNTARPNLPIRLVTPHGLRLSLILAPFVEANGRALRIREAANEAKQLVEGWASMAEPSGESLLPPAWPDARLIPLGTTLLRSTPWLAVAPVTAGCLYAMGELTPPGLVDVSRFATVPGFFVAMIVLLVPFAAWATNMTRRALRASLAKRAGVPLD